ncbi:hypothetical protein ACI6Q2_08370 [Chitinophagaceae bacterium LWZ2-11]
MEYIVSVWRGWKLENCLIVRIQEWPTFSTAKKFAPAAIEVVHSCIDVCLLH